MSESHEMQAVRPTSPPDLVDQLSELSGHFRFYALDFERISKAIATLAVTIAEQIEAGKGVSLKQLRAAENYGDLLGNENPEYAFTGAQKANSSIWLTVMMLSGKWVYQNGRYISRDDLELEARRAK